MEMLAENHWISYGPFHSLSAHDVNFEGKISMKNNVGVGAGLEIKYGCGVTFSSNGIVHITARRPQQCATDTTPE